MHKAYRISDRAAKQPRFQAMATQQTQLAQHETIPERRRSGRVTPELLTYVSFGGDESGGEDSNIAGNSCGSNGGMVLDVSESGLAVATALAIADEGLLNITITADHTHPRIELCGRVVWRTGTKRRVGVQLVDVPASNQELLRKWISALEAPDSRMAGALPRSVTDASGGTISVDAADSAIPAVAKEAVGAVSADGPATGTKVRRPAELEPQQPRPSLARTVPIAAASKQDDSLLPSRAARPAPMDGIGITSGEAKSAVAVEHGRSQPSRPVVVAALVFVVVVSFGLGIAIGRSVLAQRALHGAAGGSAVMLSSLNTSSLTGSSATRALETSSGRLPAPAATAAAEMRGNAPAVKLEVIANPRASDINDINKKDAPVASSATGENSGAVPSPSRREIIVTPNEGDTPLRIELSDEVLVQTPSLEIRSERIALVPGVPPNRRHKVPKERLVIGSMISRVTPKPPTASRAAGAQSGEQVVSVRATIAGDGHVSYVDPLSGPMVLIPSVMSAVREWSYEPSMLDGEPFPTEVELTIRFRALR